MKLAKFVNIRWADLNSDMQTYYLSHGIRGAEQYDQMVVTRKCTLCSADSYNMPHREGVCPQVYACTPQGQQKLGLAKVAQMQARLLGRDAPTEPTIQLLLDVTASADELDACQYIMQLYGLDDDEPLDDFQTALMLTKAFSPVVLPNTAPSN
jgi:hypothetical protein